MNFVKVFAFALATMAAGSLLAPASFAGDAAKGKKKVGVCKGCHTFKKGKKSKATGPALFGVVDRKAASLGDFKYSEGLKECGVTWTEAELDAYLKNPAKYKCKNKMRYKGIKKDSKRANIIAYLKTLK